jgi:hypothetical protein
VEGVSAAKRAGFAILCPLLPFVLLLRQLQKVMSTKRNQGAFVQALPLTVMLDVAWSYGEFVGYVTGHP